MVVESCWRSPGAPRLGANGSTVITPRSLQTARRVWPYIIDVIAGRRSSSESSGGSLRILDRYGVEWFLPAAEWGDAAAGVSRTPTDMGKPRIKAVRAAPPKHEKGS